MLLLGSSCHLRNWNHWAMSDSAARKSARTTFNNHANPERVHAFEMWAVNNPTGSLSVLVLNKTGAVRQLVVTNSTPAHCPLPCLTIKQKPFSIRISPRCSEEPFIAQKQERGEHFWAFTGCTSEQTWTVYSTSASFLQWGKKRCIWWS